MRDIKSEIRLLKNEFYAKNGFRPNAIVFGLRDKMEFDEMIQNQYAKWTIGPIGDMVYFDGMMIFKDLGLKGMRITTLESLIEEMHKFYQS